MKIATASGEPISKATARLLTIDNRPDNYSNAPLVQVEFAGKSDADIAAWILDPQAIKPGSSMPSFQHALDRDQAERLAKYVKTLAGASGG